MSYQTLNYELTDNIATLTLSRPEAMNALDGQMGEELFDAAMICATDPQVRAMIITGTGKMFCAGGDLNDIFQHEDNRETYLARVASNLHGAITRLSHMDAPVIMAVNGTAAGGGFSLTLSGDYVLAAEKAKFVAAYTASGLTPDGSSTAYLAKHVGLLRAKELLFTNRVLSAEEACQWGMVNRVVSADTLMSEAHALATQFATGPTKAYGGVKRLLLTTYANSLETQLDAETRHIAGSMRTHDAPHGLYSFLHKQKPQFKGE